MKIDLPGLLEERLPSGNVRYRVRMERDKAKRIPLTVTPDHEAFMEHYYAARRGIKLDKPEEKAPLVKNSLDWLCALYLDHLEEMVNLGQYDIKTLKQRRSFLNRFCEFGDPRFGEFDMNVPTSALLEFRDTMQHTPGAANNAMKTIRALFNFAIERRHCETNPAKAIARLKTPNKGATAWTVDDFTQYRKIHPAGTAAHLCLTLFVFTACRIDDAISLGRDNETMSSGVRRLEWQPKKKGSAFVSIPMAPQLFQATRSTNIIGPTYLLTEYGQPFKSPEGLRNRFKKWCLEADLGHLSSHGIRKAAGNLLAEAGATQHMIMAVHGHSEARTSEVYTRSANRANLATSAMDKLAALKW